MRSGRGRNFGWRPFEGRSRYTHGETAPGHVRPVIQRFHSKGNCSITGGVVVRDRAVPALYGRYVFGDFCRGRIESAQAPARPGERPADHAGCASRACPRSGRTRAAACTPSRSRAPSTGWLPAAEWMPELGEHGDRARSAPTTPSPYTLDGTNTWVIGRDPAWVVDPGPALEEHLDAVAAEVGRRGGAGGIALTHDHEDHAEGVAALRERLGGPPVAAARFAGDVALADGDAFGPLRARRRARPRRRPPRVRRGRRRVHRATPCSGEGSVFVIGRLGEYLAALARLRELGLAVLCPGHGPPVWDPEAKLGQYLAHRAERERKLLAALEAGARGEDELLDAAWGDAPAALRPAAALTLRAHAGKLRDEGRLPEDVRLGH